MRADYRKARAAVLDLTPSLPGTTFPKDAATFDAAITRRVLDDMGEFGPSDAADMGVHCVVEAEALLDAVEQYIDEARDLRADYAMETF
jgi:hypothetical protein